MFLSQWKTGDGIDAASESNGNLFTLPSREEENDKVVNRDKPVVNSVTWPRGDSESLRRQDIFEIRMKSDVNHSCIQRAARLAYKRYQHKSISPSSL